MKRICSQIAVSLLAMSAACSDYRTPTAPLRPGDLPPSLGISDGLHGLGNHGFFFLPPLVASPAGNSEFGDSPFKADASPHIEICQLDQQDAANLDAAVCDTDIALVKTFSAAEIKVSAADEHYHANWHTDESNLEPGLYYRVTVFVGTQELGFADLQPVSSARDLRNPKTGDVIMLVDGRTLPIKFRIEQEAVCEFQGDCVKKRIKVADGGTVSTPAGEAALIFPAGFVEGAEEVEVTLQKVPLGPGDKCHSSTHQEKILAFEFGTCYEAKSDPSIFELGGFKTPVTWVQCFTTQAEEIPEALAYLEDFVQIFKSDPPDRGGLKSLKETETPAGFCERRLGATRAPGGGAFAALRWRLDKAARQVGGLFVPTLAYAIDGGVGGILGIGDHLSRFRRGVAASMTRRGGGNFTLPVGSTVHLSVAVTGVADHHEPFPPSDDGEGEGEGEHSHPLIDPDHPIPGFTKPLRGVPVTFELVRDGIVVASATDESKLEEGEGGVEAVAGATFTLPAAGTYTLRATARAAGSPVTVTVTATDPIAGKVLFYGSAAGTAKFTQMALSLGYTVEQFTDQQWTNATQADFALYDVVVVPSLAINASTVTLANTRNVWGAAIANGNMAIAGLDPDAPAHFDDPTDEGAHKLLENLLAWGAAGRTTGFVSMIDCSNGYTWAPTIGPFVGLTAVGGCAVADPVHVTDPDHPVMLGLDDATLSNWDASVHTYFPTVGGFSVVATIGGTGSLAGQAAILVKAGTP